MAADADKMFRPWVVWLIAGVWIGTALAVLVATRIHPSTTANLSLNTRRISFRTNASHILGQSNEEQLLISGLSSLRIQFNHEQAIRRGSVSSRVASLDARGDAFASCSFYQVRSSGFEVRGPAVITLDVVDISKAGSFSLKAHGALSDNLSSLAAEHGLQAAFECRNLHVGDGPAETVEGAFSFEGGDAIYVATSTDARLDFSLAKGLLLGDTQIPIAGELRFSEIDAGTSEEKSVLLKPDPEITFQKTNKKVAVDAGDLLVVVPGDNFYLRQFTVKDGIHLSLQGSVREIRAGAGARALATLLPSAFEHMESAMRIWAAIAAGVGVLLGILEKMSILGKK